jgi:2-keto-3-deoxy-L-rhamnonate aldolase RhmA
MNGAGLREKLRKGETIYGTMTWLMRNPRLTGVFAGLGFDYVIVDSEHSPMGRAEAGDLAHALTNAGICPILRVPTTEPHQAIMALDGGFHGVLVPYCETPEEVKTVVSAARMRPFKGAAQVHARDTGEFPSEATKAYLEERNRNVVLFIGIESVAAVANLEKILDVGGIDVIFVGPNDLSISMGIPDEYDNPRFIETMDYIVRTASARGVAAGAHWHSEELVHFWMNRGSRFVLFGSDIWALNEGYRSALRNFKGVDVEAPKGE